MIRSPVLGQRLYDLFYYLRWQTSVPTKLNEFAILIIGRQWTSQVEWFAHAPLAAKAGLSADIIAELKAGKRPSGMAEDEASVVLSLSLHTKKFPRNLRADQEGVQRSAIVWDSGGIASWWRCCWRWPRKPFPRQGHRSRWEKVSGVRSSLQRSEATKQSSCCCCKVDCLPGACHRAALRADR